jgi:transposase
LKSSVLSKVYKDESDVCVRERLFLIIKVSVDTHQIESMAKELKRSRAWAYKWHKRYSDEGPNGKG